MATSAVAAAAAARHAADNVAAWRAAKEARMTALGAALMAAEDAKRRIAPRHLECSRSKTGAPRNKHEGIAREQQQLSELRPMTAASWVDAGADFDRLAAEEAEEEAARKAAAEEAALKQKLVLAKKLLDDGLISEVEFWHIQRFLSKGAA